MIQKFCSTGISGGTVQCINFNVVLSLQKMYPVNEGYRISVVARVTHDMFNSDIIVNVYSGTTLKKKRKVEL